MSKTIVVFGSINQDFFSYVERFPRPGESIRGKKFELGNGGKGANQAVAAAKLGSTVQMIGMVGDDMFGEHNIENLKNSRVHVELIAKVKDSPTGCASITVDQDGENNIVVTPGANARLTSERARELEMEIANSGLIICQLEVPEESNLEAFRLSRKHKVRTLFNPAPGNRDMDRQILEFTDIICTNETEAECITNSTLKSMNDFEEAAKKMLEYGPNISIITLGGNGVIIAVRSSGEVKLDHVKAEKVKPTDTTGAGDCFCGALAHLLVSFPDLSALDAVRKASKVAAMAVEKRGCQSSYPTLDDVKRKGIF